MSLSLTRNPKAHQRANHPPHQSHYRATYVVWPLVMLYNCRVIGCKATGHKSRKTVDHLYASIAMPASPPKQLSTRTLSHIIKPIIRFNKPDKQTNKQTFFNHLIVIRLCCIFLSFFSKLSSTTKKRAHCFYSTPPICTPYRCCMVTPTATTRKQYISFFF